MCHEPYREILWRNHWYSNVDVGRVKWWCLVWKGSIPSQQGTGHFWCLSHAQFIHKFTGKIRGSHPDCSARLCWLTCEENYKFFPPKWSVHEVVPVRCTKTCSLSLLIRRAHRFTFSSALLNLTVKSIPMVLLEQQICSCLLDSHPCRGDGKACCRKISVDK